MLLSQVYTGEVSQIGETRLYTSFAPSPDANFLLVAWLERPYSHTMPCGRFPKRVQLWDRCALPSSCPRCPTLPLVPAPAIPNAGAPLLLHHAMRPLPQARAAVGQMKHLPFLRSLRPLLPYLPMLLKKPEATSLLHSALRPLPQARAAVGQVYFMFLLPYLPDSAPMCPLL